MGGWWLTCSATYLMPLSPLCSSNVSPRIGLNGFQARSTAAKGPIVYATTCAIRLYGSSVTAALSSESVYSMISAMFCSIVNGCMIQTGRMTRLVMSFPRYCL